MKKLVLFTTLLALLVGCSNSTKDNDPWGKVDPEKTAQKATVMELSMQSSYMHQTMTYSVWLPAEYDKTKSYPILYLLHGYEYGDQSRLDRCWLDKGNASKLAEEYQKSSGVAMIIVMPNGLSSFYIGDYEDYFEKELLPKIDSDFKGNGKRAIAGLSMGGYGTLYHALKYPEKFLYAYAMSPAADASMSAFIDAQEDKSVFPAFTIEIGKQDYTVDNSKSKSLYNSMKKNGLTCELIEREGTHDWPFWQACLPKALQKVGEKFK